MDQLKKLLIIFFMIFILVGCNKDTGEDFYEPNISGNAKQKDGQDAQGNKYTFVYDGTTIRVDDKASKILEQLGKPMEYFEAPSCAYQGMDKTYYYSGFEITTYTQDNIDYIANIVLADDTVSTKEGLQIGDDVSKVIDTYGREYKENIGQYIYTEGDSNLQFIIEKEQVKSISYMKAE